MFWTLVIWAIIILSAFWVASLVISLFIGLVTWVISLIAMLVQYIWSLHKEQ